MNNINLQIYSFGFDLGLSFLDKLRKAAELGFSGVELIREYEGVPAEDVVKVLEESGIQAVSAHVGMDAIEQDLPYLAKLGVKYVACPGTPFCNQEEAKEVAEPPGQDRQGTRHHHRLSQPHQRIYRR